VRRAAGGLGLTVPLVIAAGPASAHAPLSGLDGFYAGLLHPFLVPSHALVLLGTSLLIAQASPGRARGLLLIFILAFAVGAAAALWPVALPGAETTLMGLAALSGLLTAVDLGRLRIAAAPMAVAAGLALGLDSGSDPGPLRSQWLMTLGSCLGGAVAAVVICGIAVEPAATWMRIGRRVVGSWTAAAAALVLALSLPRWR
jgi:hydrogenase/urease accessory protein HupE